MSNAIARNVLDVVSRVMQSKAGDADVQFKAFSLVGQLYDNLGTTNVPKALIAYVL